MGVHHDWRKLLAATLATGEWVDEGADGQGHGVIRHLPTGQTTTYARHGRSSDVNSVRNFAKDIERISGHQLWQRSSRKPSRKGNQGSGYHPTSSSAERIAAQRVEKLLAMWSELDRRLQECEREPSRANAQAARTLLTQMAGVRRRLEELHHPAPTREVQPR